MYDYHKLLIFNKLSRGGVNALFSADENGREAVSVTLYCINAPKTSKARLNGFRLGCFVCAASRHCD